MSLYVDTSALVKLVVAEPESAALAEALDGHALLCSDLVLTELPRAVGRVGVDADEPVVASTLARLTLVTLTRGLLRDAGRLGPPGLRTLDAIHLVSALRVREHVDALVGYDDRLADAARHHGMGTRAPGAP